MILFEIYQRLKGHFLNKLRVPFKGTLMQIWKSPNMFQFLQKQDPEIFTFLTLIILELFARKVSIFAKK